MNNQNIQTRLHQTLTDLDTVQALLNIAIDRIKLWEQSDTPITLTMLQEHRELLLTIYTRYRVLQGDYEALLSLNSRLLCQRQSAKQAYEQGWEARWHDIVAYLTEDEYAQLRAVLEQIASNDLPY